VILLLSVREWALLVARRRAAVLHEAAPVWLPEHALAEGRPVRLFGLLALGLGLIREWSGEAQFERAQRQAAHAAPCGQPGPSVAASLERAEAKKRLYVECLEKRYRGFNRCC
jgi:hypothetical protein